VQHPDRHSNADQEGGVAVLQSSEDTDSPLPPTSGAMSDLVYRIAKRGVSLRCGWTEDQKREGFDGATMATLVVSALFASVLLELSCLTYRLLSWGRGF
jgi:hypothetical protein